MITSLQHLLDMGGVILLAQLHYLLPRKAVHDPNILGHNMTLDKQLLSVNERGETLVTQLLDLGKTGLKALFSLRPS